MTEADVTPDQRGLPSTRLDRRLVIITQVLDPAHPNLGFATSWITHLSQRCSDLRVVAREGSPAHLPGVACDILDWSGSRLRRGRLLAAATHRALRGSHRAVVLGHQCPAYALAAWPAARLHGAKLALFYAHASGSRLLRTAARAADLTVSSTPEGAPGIGRTRFIGQGISPHWYQQHGGTAPVSEPGHLRLVTFGRITPVKRLHVLIDAVEQLVVDLPFLTLDIVGRPETAADRDYLAALAARVRDLALDAHVSFVGPMDPRDLAGFVRGASASVNLSSGALDKAVLESAASGVPVVTSNPAARRLIEACGPAFLSVDPNAISVATAIRMLSDPARQGLASAAWRQLAEEHRLELFVQRLADELAQL